MTSSLPNEALIMPVDRTATDPPPLLKALREERPIARLRFPDGHLGWLVTSHSAGRAVLSDPRFSMQPMRFPVGDPEALAGAFEASLSEFDYPDVVQDTFDQARAEGCPLSSAAASPAVVDALRTRPPEGTGGLIFVDPPYHSRLRRALASYFGPRKVEQHRALVETTVNRLLEDLEERGRACDLVADFSLPLTLTVICTVLGADESDIPRFAPAVETRQDPESGAEDLAATAREFRAFIRELIQRRRTTPGHDLISLLLRESELSEDELVNVAAQLFSAGFDTTANMLSLVVYTLLQDRDAWSQLCEDVEDVPNAVEEVIRFATLIQVGSFGRTAMEDVEIGNILIRKDESVIVSLASANRDPEIFERPDVLDIRRSAKGHVSFGYGVHQCLGQHLARLELTTALTALLHRLPGLRLAVPPDKIPFFGGDRQTYGMESLPVEWS